jgi:hypothetical protein
MGKYIRFLISRFSDLEISFEFSIINKSQNPEIPKSEIAVQKDWPLNVRAHNLFIWLDRDIIAGNQSSQTRHYR